MLFWNNIPAVNMPRILDILFSSNHNIHKSLCGLCFWASDPFNQYQSIDFTKIFQLKGLKPKNKGSLNFYECWDLTKKVYLASYIFKEQGDIIKRLNIIYFGIRNCILYRSWPRKNEKYVSTLRDAIFKFFSSTLQSMHTYITTILTNQ